VDVVYVLPGCGHRPPGTEVMMTSIPIPGGAFQPPEWGIGNRTLIASASSKRALGVRPHRQGAPCFYLHL